MARRDTGNRTTYWQSKRIAGMSLLRADFTSHQFSPHTHDAFVIAVTEAGGAEISSRGIAQKVGTETLFVSNPEEGQSARMDDGERPVGILRGTGKREAQREERGQHDANHETSVPQMRDSW